MRRPAPALIVIGLLLSTAAMPALAQTPPPASPSPAAPAEKIDPGPVRPDNPEPPTPAPTDSSEAEAVDPLGVSPNVAVVRLSGVWDTADGKGFSRVVGIVDAGRQRFYVQWLREPEGTVFETKELEDEDAAKLTFGDIRAEPGETGVTMFFDTVSDRDGLRDTWVLIVGQPGETRFGPAMN